MDFISAIKKKAKTLHKSIVFPETADERTLKAVEIILNEEICHPILLGEKEEITEHCKKIGVKLDEKRITFISLKDVQRRDRYANALYEIRKAKGLTLDDARKLVENLNYFAVMMVQMDEADGLVSGASSSTGDTIRPALQIIKTKEKFHKVSGIFFMVLEKRLLLFADCAVNINPNSHDLADIACDTAETAKRFGITPKVAMLSFSTAGSAKHPLVDKVRETIGIVRDRQPDLVIDGEMQVDAALVPEIAKRKFPGSKIAGDANVLIFPDLEAGNIAYKLVERLAGAKAIGPILQGLKKPVNDLSRGCSVEDIVDLAAMTVCEAEGLQYGTTMKNMPKHLRSRLAK